MKKEKGSVTLYVTLSCIILVTVLSLIAFNITNRNNNQKRQLEKISDNYSVSEEDMEQAYLEAGGENTKHVTLEEVEELIQEAKDEANTKIETLKEENNSQKQEIESLKAEIAENKKKSEYRPGDTAIVGSIWGAGTLTTSATDYFITISLDKPISTEVKSVTASVPAVQFRQNGYYLLGSADKQTTDGFSITASQTGLNNVGISFNVPAGNQNSTNNDAVAMIINGLTLRFN